MKLLEFIDYEHYVAVQKKTLTRRGIGPYFSGDSIDKISDWLKLRRPELEAGPVLGVCHGARNGLEADVFENNFSNINVFGTDLFPHSGKSANVPTKSKVLKHDFSFRKRRWIGRFDFVYSNSLDHARDPVQTLNVWLEQLNSDGVLIVNWVTACIEAGGGDCFGASLYEYIELMNSVGKLVDIIYSNVKWERGNLLRRKGLESINLAVIPKGRN